MRILAVALAFLALLAPPAAAQVEKARRIGLLVPVARGPGGTMDVFLEGLRELGWVEGRNLVVERRYGDGKAEGLAAAAAELARQNLEVIVAAGPAATMAARAATSTVPIVGGSYDCVEQGLVASLARPGGNVTGFCVLGSETALKQLSLLKQVLPQARKVALVAHPGMADRLRDNSQLASSAQALGIALTVLSVTGPESLPPTFAAMKADRVEAFLVIADATSDAMRSQLTAAAAQHRIPGMYTLRLYADAGGLMSYGPSLPAMVATWPGYVDRILKGAHPRDLPMLLPTKYELVLNERVARELGFAFPGAIILAADHIIK